MRVEGQARSSVLRFRVCLALESEFGVRETEGRNKRD